MPTSSQAKSPVTTATAPLRSSRPTSIEIGVTARKKPATSSASSRGRAEATSGVCRADFGEQLLRGPGEQAGVPQRARRHQVERGGRVRLLREPRHRAGAIVERRARHDVAVSGLGPRGHHADRDQPVMGAGRLERRVGGSPERRPRRPRPSRHEARARRHRDRAGAPPRSPRSGPGAVDAALRLDQKILGRQIEQRFEPAPRAPRRRRPAPARAGSVPAAARRPPRRSRTEPERGRSCFGVRGVLSGQNRVPEPPASSTAHRIRAARPAPSDAGAGRTAAVRYRRWRRRGSRASHRARARQHEQPSPILEHGGERAGPGAAP